MKISTPEKALLTQEFVKRHPNLPNRTLGRRLYRHSRELWLSEDSAYQAVRRIRGAKGQQARKELAHRAEHFQPARSSNWRMPKSQAKPWLSFPMPQGRSLILQDIHVPYHDDEAVGTMLDYARKLRDEPQGLQCILINGDGCDFYAASKWPRNPNHRDLWNEIRAMRSFLRGLRQEFPGCEIIYKLGNHEERFQAYLWRKAEELWNLPQLTFESIFTGAIEKTAEVPAEPAIEGIQIVQDQRIIRAGKLAILHGHELPRGTSSPVNFARTLFLKTMECALAGHMHQHSAHEGRSIWGKRVSCWSAGCLCSLAPEYARVNQWSHGFVVLTLDGKEFSVENRKIIKGKVY
jgi:hypothetical protein